MLCDRCKKRPAVIKKIQVVNYMKREINLCQECAKEVGYIKNNLSSLFPTLMSMDGLYSDAGTHNKKCPVCGSSLDSFNKTGKLGCSECYSTFLEEIRPMLRKIHGNCMHKGSSPYTKVNISKNQDENPVDDNRENMQKELQNLKKQLKEAIIKEEFELAAKLRDDIKSIEEGD